jgi:hypothetical protein
MKKLAHVVIWPACHLPSHVSLFLRDVVCALVHDSSKPLIYQSNQLLFPLYILDNGWFMTTVLCWKWPSAVYFMYTMFRGLVSPFEWLPFWLNTEKSRLRPKPSLLLLESVNNKNISKYSHSRRSQWPSGLRHAPSLPAWTLGSSVRIPLEAWMSVCVYSVFVFFCV